MSSAASHAVTPGRRTRLYRSREPAAGSTSDPTTDRRKLALLYRHWEEGQWSPWGVDLSRDREQWEAIADSSLVSFVLGSLMVAEERITTKFSGLVGAFDSEEEATFLATQQVDEARHMQFYARFQDEVIGEPALISEHVERARNQVSPAFRTVFDDKLVAAHNRLVGDPRDVEAKVVFVTLYHQIIEGTLGLTTFEFTTRFLEHEELLPGFVDGYTKIHHDEQRHIGYGTWFLREAVGERPEMSGVVRSTLLELLPAVAESLTVPEGTDPGALGASTDELRGFALDGLTRRMKIIGVSLEAA